MMIGLDLWLRELDAASPWKRLRSLLVEMESTKSLKVAARHDSAVLAGRLCERLGVDPVVVSELVADCERGIGWQLTDAAHVLALLDTEARMAS